jgi:protocatechuate 3,4-dioxygenase beta subunit
MRLLALLLGLAVAQSAAFETSVNGRVVERGSGAGVPYANVVLAPIAGALDGYRTTVADADGRFSFRAGAGSFRVHAERQGYLRGEFGSRTPGVAGTPLVIVQGQTPPPAVVTLTPTGVITGRVLDDSGPVRNVLVRALRVTYRDGERYLEMATYARTDDRGEFRLFGLAPTSYVVDAIPQRRPHVEGANYVTPLVPSNANSNRSELRVPLAQAIADGAVDPAAYDTGIFVPSLYPGTADPSSALPIDLAPGSIVPGIDLQVRRMAAVSVRGRVIGAESATAVQPLNIAVRALTGPSVSTSIERDPTGAFTVSGVPAGRYEIVARVGARLAGRADVEVADRDVNGVTITLAPGVRVSGRCIVDGVAQGGADPLLVQLVAAQPGGPGVGAKMVDTNGSFTFDNVEPGEYRLRLLARGRTIVPSAVRFGTDVLPEGIVPVTPERQGQVLEISMTLKTGTVDVFVGDRSQRPLAGTTVALVPDRERRRYSGLFRTAATDADGRAQFTDVAPGGYTVMTGDVAPAEWQNPDVIRRFERAGVAVTLQANERPRVPVVVP